MPIAFEKPLFLFLLLFIPVIWRMTRGARYRVQSPLNRGIVLAVRSLIISSLALALSDPALIRRSDRVNLFFILDISESVSREAQKAAVDYMRRASLDLGEEDQAGLILFGRRPSIEISLREGFKPLDYRSQVNTGATNIRDALQLALGKLPEEGRNRIVLFTDGNETMESAMEMAYLARSLGVEIYPAPLSSWFGQGEILLEALETPGVVPLETPFDIRILVTSSIETEGEIVLMRNGRPLLNQQVKFRPGKNLFRFADALKDQGLFLYKAIINASRDTLSQNNEGISFTEGARKARVLYLAGEGSDSHLSQSLKEQGLDVVGAKMEDLPGSLHGLLDYSAIILDNLSGSALSYGAMENLERYVKDMAGGLIMIGGDRSFGAGGYLNTPVEKALPVSMDAPGTLELPGFALVLVIDKSGSMAGSIAQKNKLEGAKIAAFSAIELLNPVDRVGILAFDTEFRWIVPMTQAGERKEIARELSTLVEGGGTDLYPAIEEAFHSLEALSAAKKHVIVLSDGLTQMADFAGLIQKMREARITVSTVAVGSDSDVGLMRSIAEWGGGRAYYADDADHIPRIFVSETSIAARKVIVEKDMRPSPAMAGEMLLGIPTEDLPPVAGQVITYPKAGASVLLKTEEGPLLAAWQYGLGRGVAFTSDLTTRWGRQWVLWGHYGKFVSQMVKWAQQKETGRNYRTEILRESGRGTFAVDVTDDEDRFVNNLDLRLKVLFPSGTDRTVSLDQVAPGRYQGSFETEETGEYYLTLYAAGPEGPGSSRIYGYGIPYPDEFRAEGVNHDLLTRLASRTKGRVLKIEEDPPDLFTARSDRKEQGRRLWPLLSLIALLLLVAEVAIRKFPPSRTAPNPPVPPRS